VAVAADALVPALVRAVAEQDAAGRIPSLMKGI